VVVQRPQECSGRAPVSAGVCQVHAALCQLHMVLRLPIKLNARHAPSHAERVGLVKPPQDAGKGRPCPGTGPASKRARLVAPTQLQVQPAVSPALMPKAAQARLVARLAP
jgi:hypothetical protein